MKLKLTTTISRCSYQTKAYKYVCYQAPLIRVDISKVIELIMMDQLWENVNWRIRSNMIRRVS